MHRGHRGTVASWLALSLCVVATGVAFVLPTPYVAFKPGPTVNVLGEYDGKPIIDVEGHEIHRDGGALRLLTVVPTPEDETVRLPELIASWIDPDEDLYPRDVIYAPTDTRSVVEARSDAQMTSSKDLATAAALGAMGVPVERRVKVAAVEKGGPADGRLEPGDIVTQVNGQAVTGVESVTAAIRPLPIGSTVQLAVSREGAPTRVAITTAASTADPADSAVRIQVGEDLDFPFKIRLGIGENIGGPSGGMMFALGIYDILTPGSLTQDRNIAGTGTIDSEGRIGGIGGIHQKLAAAQEDGAELFLLSTANCAEARSGPYDPKKMTLVQVDTFTEALDSVKTWANDDHPKLSECR